MEGKKSYCQRQSNKAKNRFLKGFSLPLLSFGTSLSVCPKEILRYDAKDYIRKPRDAYLIVSNGMLFEIWRVCFSLLKTNDFSK